MNWFQLLTLFKSLKRLNAFEFAENPEKRTMKIKLGTRLILNWTKNYSVWIETEWLLWLVAFYSKFLSLKISNQIRIFRLYSIPTWLITWSRYLNSQLWCESLGVWYIIWKLNCFNLSYNMIHIVWIKLFELIFVLWLIGGRRLSCDFYDFARSNSEHKGTK